MGNDSTFRLEVRENVDYGVLRVTVIVVSATAYMGVDNGRSVSYMSMGKHADTCIVAAEYHHQS